MEAITIWGGTYSFHFSIDVHGVLFSDCSSCILSHMSLFSVIFLQAMNFFAGILLLMMPEENAFW